MQKNKDKKTRVAMVRIFIVLGFIGFFAKVQGLNLFFG